MYQNSVDLPIGAMGGGSKYASSPSALPTPKDDGGWGGGGEGVSSVVWSAIFEAQAVAWWCAKSK